jgi:aspartyl/asparaginyl-tRNA synthetase
METTLNYKNQFQFVPKYHDSYIPVKNIYLDYEKYMDTTTMVTCKGWVLSSRKQSSNWFIQLYDGSCGNNLQIIFNVTPDLATNISNVHAGTTIEVNGLIVKSPANGQLFEMLGSSINILGAVSDPANYLPCVKGIKIENLRNELIDTSKNIIIEAE